MTARDILYKNQMILAKKNGWKNVTRRPIKQEIPAPSGSWPAKWSNHKSDGIYHYLNDGIGNRIELKCPYGQPGDQLYTKETYQILDCTDFEQAVKIRYQADGYETWEQLPDADWEKYCEWKEPFGKKPSIFMFKSLSRFWDEVTEINIERIQDITASEIWREGVRIPDPSKMNKKQKESFLENGWPQDVDWLKSRFLGPEVFPEHYIKQFKQIWQSMYADTQYALSNNPYVWVVRYKPLIVNGRIKTIAKALRKAKKEIEPALDYLAKHQNDKQSKAG